MIPLNSISISVLSWNFTRVAIFFIKYFQIKFFEMSSQLKWTMSTQSYVQFTFINIDQSCLFWHSLRYFNRLLRFIHLSIYFTPPSLSITSIPNIPCLFFPSLPLPFLLYILFLLSFSMSSIPSSFRTPPSSIFTFSNFYFFSFCNNPSSFFPCSSVLIFSSLCHCIPVPAS
jgi:hypothetical protein